MDAGTSGATGPKGANPDAQAACDAYEASILLAGGVDLQLLGLGHNGHIGFNEPTLNTRPLVILM